MCKTNLVFKFNTIGLAPKEGQITLLALRSSIFQNLFFFVISLNESNDDKNLQEILSISSFGYYVIIRTAMIIQIQTQLMRPKSLQTESQFYKLHG
jgi:hypothetical protein